MEREGNRSADAKVDPIQTQGFFQWLTDQLDRIFDDATVRSLVTSKLRAVSPCVKWEAGPWDDGRNYFAISPNMNIDAVPIAEQIVRMAPLVEGWVFLPAKPRKVWQRIVRFDSSDGNQGAYDLSDWEYWLTAFNNREFFDINLVPGQAPIPDSELQRLGELLAASELGEAVFLSNVGKVNVVPRDSLTSETSSIKYLHAQFMGLLEQRSRH
jgi:hypothetical protein